MPLQQIRQAYKHTSFSMFTDDEESLIYLICIFMFNGLIN